MIHFILGRKEWKFLIWNGICLFNILHEGELWKHIWCFQGLCNNQYILTLKTSRRTSENTDWKSNMIPPLSTKNLRPATLLTVMFEEHYRRPDASLNFTYLSTFLSTLAVHHKHVTNFGQGNDSGRYMYNFQIKEVKIPLVILLHIFTPLLNSQGCYMFPKELLQNDGTSIILGYYMQLCEWKFCVSVW